MILAEFDPDVSASIQRIAAELALLRSMPLKNDHRSQIAGIGQLARLVLEDSNGL